MKESIYSDVADIFTQKVLEERSKSTWALDGHSEGFEAAIK